MGEVSGTRARLLRSWRASSVGYIGSVALSPDASLLASASGQELRVWDTASGALRSSFNGNRERVEALTFHPDGHRVYTSGHGIIKEFELDRNDLLDDAISNVLVAVVSPDGRYIASGSVDKVIGIYDAASGHLIRRP